MSANLPPVREDGDFNHISVSQFCGRNGTSLQLSQMPRSTSNTPPYTFHNVQMTEVQVRDLVEQMVLWLQTVER